MFYWQHMAEASPQLILTVWWVVTWRLRMRRNKYEVRSRPLHAVIRTQMT